VSEILFGQSYYLRFDPKLWRGMQPYPPLGTLYAASYLRELGYDVAVVDAMLASSEAEWARALDCHGPRFAVLFEDNFNYLSKMCLLRMRQSAFTMMGMARQRRARVIVSGSDATDHLQEYFDHGAEFILLGEGEITLGELIDALTGRGPRDLEEIRGLAYRQADGAIRRTPPREYIRNLDVLPFPARDLVDIPRYRQIWRKRHGYFSINMVTTRGCPYSCNWCAKPIYGQRYNVRSPENVVAEMRWLKEHLAPDHIWFADDIFGLKPGWMERFAELVTQEDCAIPFKCQVRADLISDSVAVALARAKCESAWIGAESGSQKILDAMDKNLTVEEIQEATRRLHHQGIRVAFFLQFGYPGETREDIEKTLQLLREGRPDDIGISVSYPLPGTKFYQRVQEQLGEKRNWIDSDDLAMMYHGTYSTEFYRTLHRAVHAEFRLRRAPEELRRALRHPWRWRTRVLRLVLAIPCYALRLARARRKLARLERHGVHRHEGQVRPRSIWTLS